MLQLQLEQQSRHITTLKASCGSLRRRMDGLHREKRDIVASIRARAQATGTVRVLPRNTLQSRMAVVRCGRRSVSNQRFGTSWATKTLMWMMPTPRPSHTDTMTQHSEEKFTQGAQIHVNAEEPCTNRNGQVSNPTKHVDVSGVGYHRRHGQTNKQNEQAEGGERSSGSVSCADSHG